jgi:PAS domain S-box-containing protein
MARLKSDLPRKSGLSFIGDVAWGTHLCQFYQTKKDLIDILVPYFRASLENNEFCMWVTAEPLDAAEAKNALEEAIPDFSRYLKRGQIEILSYKDWYVKGGVFDSDRVLRGWVSKLNDALEKGFAGLRLTGTTFWLEKKDWKAFTDYEEAVNSVIGKYRMIAICTYCLNKCNANEILGVIKNHQFALIKRNDIWEVIESAEKRESERVQAELRERKLSEEKLREASVYARSLLEASLDPIVTINAEGKITDVNKATELVTGISREHLIGSDFSDYFTDPEDARKGYQKVLTEGFVKDYPLAIRSRSGKTTDVLYNATLYRNEAGEVQGIFAAARDVTDRMKAEAAVQAERKRLFDVLETLPTMVCLLTPDYHVAFANRSFREKFGESGGRPCYEYCYGESEPCEFCETYDVLKTGKPHNWEVTTPEGSVIDVYDYPFKDVDGSPMILEMDIDITKRKRAEAELKKHREHLEELVKEHTRALRESEQRWSTTLASIGDAVIATDLDGKVTFMNAVAEELTGWALEEASQKPTRTVFNIVNEQTRLQVENPVAKVLEKGVVVGLGNHTILVRKDGTEVPVDDSGAPIRDENGAVMGVVLVFRDITDRKRAEDAIRLLNERFEMAQHATGVGVWDWDVKTGNLEWTPEMFRLFGIDPQKNAASFKSWQAVLHPEDREKAAAKIDEAVKTHSVLDNEYRVIRPDGQIIWINALGQGEYDSENQPIRMTGICIDITERKRTENELRETRDYLENLLNYANAPIIVWDPEFRITRFNHAFERLTGLSSNDAVGKNLDILFPLDKKEESMARIKQTLEGQYMETVEIPILYVDGTVKTLLWNSANIYDPDGKKVVATIAQGHDITERKAMQNKLEDYRKHLENLVEEKTRQLRDAERLSAIGETAGMVGHDIRNPLQAIIGELYLAKGELDSLPEGEAKDNLKDTVKEIEEQVTYINKIVTDLQDYAKPLAPCFEEVDLENAIQSVLSATPIPDAIKVTYFVKDGFPKLVIDPSYTRRIFTNLISNAIQAMPNGGKLTINAHSKDNKEFITVEDTGEGIPEEAKVKIFKPLFTTKAKGQGFGLAVVKKLTDALGGTITFESEPGKGTKFTIELPIKP